MKITSLLLFAIAAPLTQLPALADTYVFNNDTTGANVFNRPTEPGDDLSAVGTAVPYFAQSFTVDLSGNYNLSVLAGVPATFDTFIHLYSTSFNPSAPLDHIILGNDDAVNGNPDLGSALNGQSLLAGNTYVFVIDGFGNSDSGPFTASISGPGHISAVPEPATLTLAGLGLLGFGLARRQARRSAN